MLLVDALYINNSGGKILLDYLIKRLECSGEEIVYLLDNRVKSKHPPILTNSVTYMSGNLVQRFFFYKRNKDSFKKILCFGNLPPIQSASATVYTYFHQPLFIDLPKELPFKQKFIINIKTLVLGIISRNTNVWLVQSENVKLGLKKKYKIKTSAIQVLPFYPILNNDENVTRIKNRFIYVSGNAHHKNQNKLINSFIKFYNAYKQGELHLTIGSEHSDLCKRLEFLRTAGYPIFNNGFVNQQALRSLYRSSEYSIYPSLAESFGLGIIEAIENGCKIIGADRPYMYAVCEPSLSFDPNSEEAIFNAFKTAVFEELPDSRALVSDQIEDLISLLVSKN
jgi:glycosyltransferase involved in cell wall biosynthesis